MTEQYFIETCVKCGYASGKRAKQYLDGKNGEELNDSDFAEVHRINERKIKMENGNLTTKFRDYQGIKTTKRLKEKTGVY